MLAWTPTTLAWVKRWSRILWSIRRCGTWPYRLSSLTALKVKRVRADVSSHLILAWIISSYWWSPLCFLPAVTSCAADLPSTPVAPTTHTAIPTTAAPVTNVTTPVPPTPTLPTPVIGNYSISPDINKTACLMANFGLRIGFKQGEVCDLVEPNVFQMINKGDLWSHFWFCSLLSPRFLEISGDEPWSRWSHSFWIMWSQH